MAQLVFTRNTPRRVFAPFESPLSEYRQSQNRPAMRLQFGSLAAGLCAREGVFWRQSNGLDAGPNLWQAAFRRLISILLQCMIPLSTNQKIPKPQGDEWPASYIA